MLGPDPKVFKEHCQELCLYKMIIWGFVYVLPIRDISTIYILVILKKKTYVCLKSTFQHTICDSNLKKKYNSYMYLNWPLYFLLETNIGEHLGEMSLLLLMVLLTITVYTFFSYK